MDENLARMIMMGIAGMTVSVAFIAMAITRIVTSRRQRELPEASIARLEERLERMEHAIDAMAVEVERVAEGQRFTSRLLERQVERQS
jgi:hypothetical protein